MPRSPASVPDLCISSRSSPPKAGVSFLLSSSRYSCRVMRVASEIRLLVLVHTSVVVERGYQCQRQRASWMRRGPSHIGPHWAEGVGRAPSGGVWVGVWFSSRLYYPFGKGPGQHIIRCLKNKKCENERTRKKKLKHLKCPGPNWT